MQSVFLPVSVLCSLCTGVHDYTDAVKNWAQEILASTSSVSNPLPFSVSNHSLPPVSCYQVAALHMVSFKSLLSQLPFHQCRLQHDHCHFLISWLKRVSLKRLKQNAQVSWKKRPNKDSQETDGSLYYWQAVWGLSVLNTLSTLMYSSSCMKLILIN